MEDCPIKICDYCGNEGMASTFQSGETICPLCMRDMPTSLSEARKIIHSMRHYINELKSERLRDIIMVEQSTINDAVKLDRASRERQPDKTLEAKLKWMAEKESDTAMGWQKCRDRVKALETEAADYSRNAVQRITELEAELSKLRAENEWLQAKLERCREMYRRDCGSDDPAAKNERLVEAAEAVTKSEPVYDVYDAEKSQLDHALVYVDRNKWDELKAALAALEAENVRIKKLYDEWGFADSPCPKHSKPAILAQNNCASCRAEAAEAERDFQHGRAEAYHNEAVKYRGQVDNLSLLLQKMSEQNQNLRGENEWLRDGIKVLQ